MKISFAGGWKEPGTEGLKVFNPVTEELIDTVPALTPDDIDAAVEAAKEGQKEWASFSQMKRNEILRHAKAIILRRREQMGALLCSENGKRVGEAEEEFDTVAILIDSYTDAASHLYGNSLPNGTDGTCDHGDMLVTRFEPVGTVACLLPFNFPVELCGHKIVPALAAGNAVIVKPPTECPLAVAELIACFIEAGVPAKAVQVVTGRGSKIGDYFAGHPGIQALTMTGGTETGIQIAGQTAKNLTRTYLELGGNDAFIVLADADLDLAVSEALDGRTNNAGQVCCASKRFLVQRDVADAFRDKLIAALKEMKVGDPMDRSNQIGSMISSKAAAEVRAQIDQTVAEGAKLVYGGEVNGSFMIPAVLTDVTPEMEVAKDMEIFGAVFPIIPFDTPADAIAIANGSSFGLNGAVFSADMAVAISMAEQMQSGGVVINGCTNYRTAAMPFGGYKKSGLGREGSSRTLMEFVQEKTYVLRNVFGRV